MSSTRGLGVGGGLVMACLCTTTGCISASLASNTGPLRAEREWSVASRQWAHVGEEIQFDFVLLDWLGRFIEAEGAADYCAATLGLLRVEAEPDEHGHCGFQIPLAGLKDGERATVQACAYRRRGGRDFARVRGAWVPCETSPGEMDVQIACDKIELRVYAAEIVVRLDRGVHDLEPETGIMRIRRSDGKSSLIYSDRPGRRGFRLTDRTPEGYYEARYVPEAWQLNPSGTTVVEFVILERNGERHESVLRVATP